MKNVLISIAAVLGILFCSIFMFKGCENGARSREKIVETQIDNISVEQENLFNTLSAMAQNVKYGVENEKDFQIEIAKMRSGNAADIDGNINTFLAAVRENPPVWSSSGLIKDMGIAIQKYNENVAKTKKAYRKAVESYEFYTEKFPNSSVLNMQGYQIKEYEHFYDNSSLKIETKKIESLY